MPNVPVHILYVDDDDILIRLVERACERRGYALSRASSVEQALGVLAARRCSLVVLDHDLGGETGMDFLRAMETVEASPPVIYVTGSNDTSVAVNALKAGASDYVPKSASGDFIELLFSAIDPALERGRLERARLAAERETREARDRAELLLREVNHRIANSLALVASLVRLQSSVVSDPQAIAALTETQARIKAIAGVHRRLYTSTEVGRVALDEYIHDLVEDLRASVETDSIVSDIDTGGEAMAVSTDKAVAIGVAVTELVTNGLKYAYPENAPGPVRVVLRRVGADRSMIAVEDDGIGWNGTGTAKGTGLGARIVKAMMSTLNSELAYGAEGRGTRAVFEVELIRKSEA